MLGHSEGDCDCDGNQLDALGVCGGDCAADVNGNGLCDADEVSGCTDAEACNYDGDATFDDGSCAELDDCGICGGPGAIYECGCEDIPEGDCDCDGNQLDAIGVCGGDCTEDVNENNICDTDEQGCTDPTNPNYDPNAAFDDGSCFVGGCTFPTACNYNPDADYQIQGSCDFTSCTGCTNPEACNYDPEATLDNGLCDLPDFAYDCDGNCLNDADGDGVCDELEVLGCTEANSPNFDPYATDDDGTCLTGGCTIPSACNFDPAADYLIAGACEFASCVGCMDEDACNFDPGASVPNLNLCVYPAGQFLDCDGNCTTMLMEMACATSLRFRVVPILKRRTTTHKPQTTTARAKPHWWEVAFCRSRATTTQTPTSTSLEAVSLRLVEGWRLQTTARIPMLATSVKKAPANS